jgi:hypothetical protein
MESNPVTLTAAGGGAVAGTLSISGDHTIMTLLPNSPLTANTSYTVSVSGVADVSGNVAPAFSSSFSTGTTTLTAHPSVVSVNPANGANGVSTNIVQISFSAPIDGTSVNSGSLPIRINNSTLVNGSYAVSGGVVSFAPSQPWPTNTAIFVTINSGSVLDTAGNTANFFQSSFTTGPVAVTVSPNNGALSPGQTEQFAAMVVNSSNTAVTWSLSPAGAGTINSTGLYTAPAAVPASPVVTITATSVADPTKTANAVVTLFSPATFSFNRTVTIDHTKVPSDQSNFPVLISGAYSFLATVANGGRVQSPNGYDIIFTSDAAGVNKLDHEIESYDPVTGTVNFWVRVPALSHSTDTVIYMQYGSSAVTTTLENKAGVWDSNYLGVWHLPKAGGLTAKDSTADGNNGTITGASGIQGVIDGGASFNGSGQFIDVGNGSSLQITGTSLTIEAWIKTSESNPAPWERILAKETPGNTDPFLAYGLIRHSGTNLLNLGIATGGAGTGVGLDSHSSLTMGAWTHVVGSYDGSTLRIFMNGVLDNQTAATGNITSTNQDVVLGADTASNIEYFNGSMDEVRLSNVARSSGWVATEYANQNSPATFYSVGPEQ